MNQPKPLFGSQAMELEGQHRMLIDRSADGHVVRFVTSGGSVPIAVEVTAQGITLKLDSPSIALHASGTLDLTADKLRLGARQGLEISSGGTLSLVATGQLSTVAAAQSICSERGSIKVKASDDVKLSGERVMVNCDETVDRYYREPAMLTSRPRAAEALPPTPPQGPASKPG